MLMAGIVMLVSLLVVEGALPAAVTGQEAADEAPFSPKCLAAPRPIELETCFEEFLALPAPSKVVWNRFIETVKKELYYNQRLRSLRIHSSVPDKIPFSSRAPSGTADDTQVRLILRTDRRNEEVPYLSSGGWINVMMGHPFLIGHSEVTRDVLRDRFSFSYRAQAIAADASQDPDLYAWTTDAAHAQTPATESGIVAATDWPKGELAATSFVNWLSGFVREVKRHCQERNIHLAIYALGYALHGVQDLAAHNGRTSYEHAWNSYCRNSKCDGGADDEKKEGDPDEDPLSIERARRYSARFLTDVRSFVGTGCWSAMKYYEGEGVTSAEKHGVFNLRWNLTLSEFFKYKSSRFKFAEGVGRPGYVVRWVDVEAAGDVAPAVFKRVKDALGGR